MPIGLREASILPLPRCHSNPFNIPTLFVVLPRTWLVCTKHKKKCSRSPSENCFLKRAAATENRVVKTASQSSPDEARGNARRRASREQPLPLCVAFLALVYP